jgi:SAM-dependent methyltransferase
MLRACLPEMLDSLPPDHPDALHGRRDLRIINRIMRNHAWFGAALPPLLRGGECVLELGAGTGELAARLAARGVAVDGLDLWPRPGGWPPDRTWYKADLLAFDGFERYPAVIGNLIFHQFTDAELAGVGAKLRRKARVIVACEPERRRMSQIVTSALAPLLGIGHVTLHDARVSVAAGFRGDELPRLLGLDGGAWRYSCNTTTLGANRMVAVRAE